MIIEFIGVSGSGKTTVAKKIYDEYLNSGVNVNWNTYYLYKNKKWLVRNLIKLLSVIKYGIIKPGWCKNYFLFVRSKKINLKESLKLLFNGIFLKTQISNISDTNQVYLFDEGVLQYLWAIYLRSNCPLEKMDLQTICDLFCTPKQVISIEADAETIVKRINSRNEFVSIMKSSDLYRRVKEMQDIQHKIVSFAVENGIQVIRYDNN